MAFTQPRVSYYNGGGERYALDAIKALSAHSENEIYLFTTKSKLPETDHYRDFKANYGEKIKIFELALPKKIEYIYNIEPGELRYRWDIESINFNALIYNELKHHKIDILWSFYILDGIFIPESVKSIINLIGYPREKTYYLEGLLSRYDLIVSNSFNVISKWNDILAKKIKKYKVLPQGINLGLNHPGNKKNNNNNNNNIVIMFAGRYIERKGIIDLISSFSILKKRYNNIELRLFGEGPLLNEMNFLVIDKKLNGSVIINGFVNNIKVEMQNADFCVFPSWKGEGLMSTVLEAMYYNGLVLTTSDNGSEEVIDNGVNGLIVSPNSTKELVDAMSKIISNMSDFENMRVAAKKTIFDNFSWKNYSEKFNIIINSLN